jgi:hypothetical protein
MAVAYLTKQVVGTAATSTYSTLYSTGASTTAVVSSILVCNEAAASVTVRIGLAASAATPASGAFLVYDRVVPANDTLILNLPVTLGNTTFIRTSSSAATCSFTAAVGEVS